MSRILVSTREHRAQPEPSILVSGAILLVTLAGIFFVFRAFEEGPASAPLLLLAVAWLYYFSIVQFSDIEIEITRITTYTYTLHPWTTKYYFTNSIDMDSINTITLTTEGPKSAYKVVKIVSKTGHTFLLQTGVHEEVEELERALMGVARMNGIAMFDTRDGKRVRLS